MPAAAVIPAPVAYAKVVAVKKLVVGLRLYWLLAQSFERSRTRRDGVASVSLQSSSLGSSPCTSLCGERALSGAELRVVRREET